MSGRRLRGRARRVARAADEALLVERLSQLGASRAMAVHENRTVLVSLTSRGVLRVHRGYAYAPDRVLRAVLTFVDPAVDRRQRRGAERELLAFPVDDYVTPAARPRRRPKSRPGDRRLLARLRELHERLNRARFAGVLSPVRFRISERMRRRLGELSLDSGGDGGMEIAIGRHHLVRDGWEEVELTVLHEMVHQWQAESGLAIDHGPSFRRKAAAVGILPRADREVRARRAARMT